MARMVLERKAYKAIEDWKASPSRRALLVTGARQVGKTYLVREFASHEYDALIELNFILDPNAAALFGSPHATGDIERRLSIATDTRPVPGRTLVFLDEVQKCPEALTAIKGLVDSGRYDFVLSGSLLGTELRGIRSNPAGYVAEVEMFPLDFEEFCWAHGIGADMFSYLRDCMARMEPVDGPIHERFMSLFREYLVVGGMPDAVAAYRASNDLAAVRSIQEDVKRWYRADIAQYCPDGQKVKAREAFDLVPSELNNPNKRFILKNLNENARFRSYEDAFLWLAHAGVALAAYNVQEPASPLLLSKERNLFKLFYSDVGLLSSSFSRRVALELLEGGVAVNFGSVYESAVAQELASHGFDLYYFNSKKHGELDFVVESRDGDVIPIEVKSGKGYKRHRALNNVMDVSNWGLDRGLVLADANVERHDRLNYLPVYFASLLENRE